MKERNMLTACRFRLEGRRELLSILRLPEVEQLMVIRSIYAGNNQDTSEIEEELADTILSNIGDWDWNDDYDESLPL